MPTQSRLFLTALEDRLTPAIFGIAWPDAKNLSLSFAKDGTNVGGVSSALQSFLGATAAPDAWQGEIRRAFQTWAAVTNVDVHVVSDDGTAFGSDSTPQGSPTHGDIRVAARPLSTNALAVTNPPDMISGWAGEIILNSNYNFSVGGGNGTYDLYSVALHEAGHALGLSHDTTQNSADVMFEDYAGVRTGLSAGDVSAIQKMYGAREADAFEGNNGNETTKTATQINYLSSLALASDNYIGGGAIANVVRAGLTTASDVDVYKVQLPALGSFSFPRLQLTTSLVSQLVARVSVLDDTGKVLLSAAASGPSKDVSLDLKSLAGGKTYYVKVEAAVPGVFGTGDYRLAVGGALSVTLGSAFTSEFSTSGKTLETNGAFSGIDFGNVQDNADARWDATGRSQLTSALQMQYFDITAKSDATAMLAAVWTNGDISPKLRVTDSAGRAVAFQVLRADRFATLIQILGVNKNAKYRLTLSSGNWQQPTWAGPVNYRMAADFRSSAITLAPFANGMLNAANPTASRAFTLTQSQVFRFELTASSLLAQAGASATLTITDGNGKVAFALAAGVGQTVADDVFLAAGTYTVKLAASAGTMPLFPLGVFGRFTPLTDPIGPALIDPLAPTAPMPTIAPPTSAPTQPVQAFPPPPPSVDLGYFWGAVLVDPLGILFN